MWGSILILIASCHWQTFQTFCRRMQRCFTFPCQYGSRVLVVTSVTNCQCPHKCWIGYLFPVCKSSGKMPSCSLVYFLRFPMNICLTQHCYNVVSLIHMYTFVSARLSSGKWLSFSHWLNPLNTLQRPNWSNVFRTSPQNALCLGGLHPLFMCNMLW